MVIARELKKHPFYNYNKVCSYNGVFNFIIGGRGLGKTYGAKVRAVKKFLKTGEMFIYLRRYKTELEARTTFFTDFEHTMPDWDFRVKGMTAECAPVSTRGEEKRAWRLMGYFMALSTTQAKKGMSFTNVTTIIFDEFIIERGVMHYLNDEATVMTNFYSTVDRAQDKTTVFFLANSVSIMNPYFLEYEIRPDEDTDILTKRKGFIVCHFPKAEDFANSVYQTRFGQFIQGTEYADYAIGNTFDDNHEELLEIKDGQSRYKFSIETKKGKFSVWYNGSNAKYFVQSSIPKAEEVIFVLDPAKMAEGKIFAVVSDGPLNYLRRGWRTGMVKFDKPATREIFQDIFKR